MEKKVQRTFRHVINFWLIQNGLLTQRALLISSIPGIIFEIPEKNPLNVKTARNLFYLSMRIDLCYGKITAQIWKSSFFYEILLHIYSEHSFLKTSAGLCIIISRFKGWFFCIALTPTSSRQIRGYNLYLKPSLCPLGRHCCLTSHGRLKLFAHILNFKLYQDYKSRFKTTELTTKYYASERFP